jgi:ferredoxin
MRDNASNPGVQMVDELPNTIFGWNYFTRMFLANFTSSTETFDLRDQLKKLVWNPDKDAIKAHILTMTTILHSMALLGDVLTDRDKVEYFMSSLVMKSYLVRKINLTGTFDQACRDIVDYVSKEQIARTIIDQHAYKQPAGAKLYNMEPCSDDDDDDEAYSHDYRSTPTLQLLYDAELNAMRMAWLDKLNPEERRRFDNQLCIGCGEPGHNRRECPHLAVDQNGKTIYPRAVDNSGMQRNVNHQTRPSSPGPMMNKNKTGPGPRQLPKHDSHPNQANNNNYNFNASGNPTKHNMGG